MTSDHPQCFGEQLAAGRELVPGRCTAGVRLRDEVEGVAGPLHHELAAADGVQLVERDELPDREPADRNDEPRLKDFEFSVHPRGAIADLLWIGNAVTAAGCFAGKAAINRCEVDSCAHGRLIESAKFFKPAEE